MADAWAGITERPSICMLHPLPGLPTLSFWPHQLLCTTKSSHLHHQLRSTFHNFKQWSPPINHSNIPTPSGQGSFLVGRCAKDSQNLFAGRCGSL